MKSTQTERILQDLLQGLHLNMLNNIQRYGTSMRSRISQLRAEGYPIEDYKPKGEQFKIYFLPASFLSQYHAEKVSA